MTRFYCFGEGLLRLATPLGERLATAPSLVPHPAGAELNVAAALASLGCEAIWLSALPDNPLGRRVAAAAAAAGVDVSRVQWIADGRLGVFYAETGVPPRATAVTYDRRDSAFGAARPDLRDCGVGDWLVVSGVTLALGESIREAAVGLIAAAQERGGRVCVDVNYRARLWSPEEAAEVLAPVLAGADLVVCGRRDAELLFGASGSPADALAGLRELAPRAEPAVLSCGADGALACFADGEPVHQPAYPAAVVDPIGAGDAFLAGLLWALESHGPAAAMARAAALGALACTVPGDFAPFTATEVEAVLGGDGEPLR